MDKVISSNYYLVCSSIAKLQSCKFAKTIFLSLHGKYFEVYLRKLKNTFINKFQFGLQRFSHAFLPLEVLTKHYFTWKINNGINVLEIYIKSLCILAKKQGFVNTVKTQINIRFSKNRTRKASRQSQVVFRLGLLFQLKSTLDSNYTFLSNII